MRPWNRRNKEYEIIGMHWRGGESDLFQNDEYIRAELYKIYSYILNTYSDILNVPPIILHKIVCADCLNKYGKLHNMEFANSMFDKFAEEYENIETFDARELQQYDPEIIGRGLFKSDLTHFTADVNKEIANNIFFDYVRKHKK